MEPPDEERTEAMSKQKEKISQEAKKELLTIAFLHLRREIFFGGGISRDDFDRSYLGGLGEYERKIARRERIKILP